MSGQAADAGATTPGGVRFAGRGRARWVHLALLTAAPFGLALGLGGLVMHLQTDPLVDLRAYYEAGARLNAGQPLYEPSATSPTGLYLYPPLLAILFRPLALLPFEVVAPAWVTAMVAALVTTGWLIRPRPIVLTAAAVLALPLTWAIAIGQIEPLLTLLLAWGSPFTIALAGHLKLAPLLVAVYWVARRDMLSLGRLAAWVAALGLVQLVLAPTATLDYLRLEWTQAAFGVRNISPFAVHPVLWAAMVGVLLVAAWRTAGGGRGWALAVALAVLAYPRLLAYQLLSLLAGFGGPEGRTSPDHSVVHTGTGRG